MIILHYQTHRALGGLFVDQGDTQNTFSLVAYTEDLSPNFTECGVRINLEAIVLFF